ncbi:MAG: ATP-binding protein, partial [Jatrophihabitantaceae bacterium]
ETFAVQSVAVLRQVSESPTMGPRGGWQLVASVGVDPCQRPEDADTEVPVGTDLLMVLRGRKLAAEDQRLLAAFATEVAVAYQQRQLADAAGAARELAETDRARTALLNAVSHDLRTPISSAKAAVSSLRSEEIDWTEADRQQLLSSADQALDRLTALVTNLLDLSRLQAGALSVTIQPVGVDDIVNRALSMVSNAGQVELDVPDELPEVLADPGLLERVIANVLENALRYSPADAQVRVIAREQGETVELQVLDRGPGIAPAIRQAVFEPFQRRDDRAVSTGAGVGLGLAIARGFVESMHGAISLDDTPGGGLIVNIALPVR